MRGQRLAPPGAGAGTLIERAARAAFVLALLAQTSCASVLGRSPEDRQFAVSLSVSRAAAVRRTLAAFREQGYTLKESLTSGTEMETEPFRHQNEADVVFRATIAGDARSSRVVLTGTYRRRQLGGILRGEEQEIRRADDGLEGELWTRLRNLSLAIRTPQ